MSGARASDRREQLRHAEDRYHPLQIVGQNVQRHLGSDVFQRLHLEVRGAHTRLDRPEGMLDGLASQRHLVGRIVEPLLDALKDVLVLPATDAALESGGAAAFDRTASAGVRPV